MNHRTIYTSPDGVVTLERIGGWVTLCADGIHIQNARGNWYRLRASKLKPRPTNRRTTGGRLKPRTP